MIVDLRPVIPHQIWSYHCQIWRLWWMSWKYFIRFWTSPLRSMLAGIEESRGCLKLSYSWFQRWESLCRETKVPSWTSVSLSEIEFLDTDFDVCVHLRRCLQLLSIRVSRWNLNPTLLGLDLSWICNQLWASNQTSLSNFQLGFVYLLFWALFTLARMKP